MKIYFLLVLMFAVMSLSYSQGSADGTRVLPVNVLKKNYNIFRDSLEQIHPALYIYRSKKEVDRLFDSCYSTIKKDMTEVQFYMLLRYMTSAIEDGHTATTLERDLRDEQFEKAKMFPWKLWFIDNKTFLLCDVNEELNAGTEILSINKKRINELRELLFKYLVSDGKIESKKYAEFNEGAFPVLYYWLYGEQSHFTVTYKTKTGKIGSTTVAADYLQNIKCSIKTPDNSNYLKLEFNNADLAILTIKTFDINRLNDDETYFGRFLDSSFKEIKAGKISKLIIDVRDNGGGEDFYGSLLYSYLTDQPFPYYSSLETISFKYPKEAHANLNIQRPKENSFMGKCYFLINGKSFSTTSEFCAIARSNNRGIFIGEETGGGYYGNTGGEQSKFTLPETRVVIIIPRRKYVLAVKPSRYKNRGTIPHHNIIPAIDDVIKNKDVQLEYALKLAAEERGAAIAKPVKSLRTE